MESFREVGTNVDDKADDWLQSGYKNFKQLFCPHESEFDFLDCNIS